MAEWKQRHAARQFDPTDSPCPTEMTLRRDPNAAQRPLPPWRLEATKLAVQETVVDRGAAFWTILDRRGRHPRIEWRGARDGFCALKEVGRFPQ